MKPLRSRLPAFRLPAPALRLLLLGVFGGIVPGCDLFDVASVDNPRTTDDDLANAPQPTQALLPGLRAQFADALGEWVIAAEAVSDNYAVRNSGLSAGLDRPRDLTPQDETLGAVGGPYFELQRLRAYGDFVLDDIIPDDATATPALRAEAHYYRGMAYLMLGETYAAAPTRADEAPVPARTLLQRALADFAAGQALAPGEPLANQVRAAQARTHRALGDAAQADAVAAQALATDAAFVYSQAYDAGSLSNAPYGFLVGRSLQDLQPLPRLDFLDPKYTSLAAAIPVAKAEEMLFIRAEAAMAAGDYTTGRAFLAQAVALARTESAARPRVSFTDADARNAGGTLRPRDAVFQIRADASAPPVAGLVLQRPGALRLALVSNTSLTPEAIAAVDAADEGALRRLLFLARQEVLFLEGRRLHDLGIRLPMMQQEITTNPALAPGDPGTVPVVPAWIPPGDEMDRYTPEEVYDPIFEFPVTTELTMLHDLNRLLATQRGLVLTNPLLD